MEVNLLYEFLDRYLASAAAEDRAGIETEIWARFGREAFPFVLDMSGFSQSVREHGIVHYLGQIRAMQQLAGSQVALAGGEVVKFEADNMFAVFAEPLAAIKAALAIQQRFAEHSVREVHFRRLAGSIGIAFGRLIHVPGHDYFGDCVNVASKLGEDLGQSGQVLVCDTAFRRLPQDHGLRVQAIEFSISGLPLSAFRIV